MDNVGSRVVTGLSWPVSQRDAAKIGGLARHERADRVTQAQGDGAIQGGHAQASPLATLASSAAWRASRRTSSRLLLAALSVPRPTHNPAASISAIGAMPLASFRFDVGQWATLQPWRANCSISPAFMWMA
jgi:hypothetical protein